MPVLEPRRKLQDSGVVSHLAWLLRTGTARAEALRQVGVSESTFYRELRRSPELREFLEQMSPDADVAPIPSAPTAKADRPEPTDSSAGEARARPHEASRARARARTPATGSSTVPEKAGAGQATTEAETATGPAVSAAGATRVEPSKRRRRGTRKPNRASASKRKSVAAPVGGAVLESVPAAHIDVVEFALEPAAAAPEDHAGGIALSAADWLPPAAVLIVQLAIGVAVGAHPAVLVLLTITIGGLLLALRMMRHDVPLADELDEEFEAPVSPVDDPADSVEEAARRRPMDLTWVGATIKYTATQPDDPNEAQKRP